MVKGMKEFIRGIIEENQGGFESSRGKYVDWYDWLDIFHCFLRQYDGEALLWSELFVFNVSEIWIIHI